MRHKNLFVRLLRKMPKIYLGMAPKDAPVGSWILFPYNPNILRCGLAAIVEVKQEGKKNDAFLVERVAKELKDLQTLEQLIDAEFDEEKFLDALEKHTMLRDDERFCAAMRERQKQEVLRDLAEKLKKLLEEGEKESKGKFSQEARNAALVRLKDILWRIEREFFGNLTKIRELMGRDFPEVSSQMMVNFRHLNGILDIIDRLEIRGRDSAGLGVEISLEKSEYLAFSDKLRRNGLDAEFSRRKRQNDLVAGTIRCFCANDEHRLTFVAKVASEIGKLGDNVRKLRATLKNDAILHAALSSDPTRVRYLSHTRWASNGIINIYNCHPVDNESVVLDGVKEKYRISSISSHPHYSSPGHIFAVLNGDIDNYEELKELQRQRGVEISRHITTDTKIIALEIERHLEKGMKLEQAFRNAVAGFHGSHAIAMQSDLEPAKTFLALKGSGQAIYVGISSDRFVVASEVYGLVEDTDVYLAMDGETPRLPGEADSQGQILVLDENKGGLAGIKGCYYDGAKLNLSPKMLQRAEITTRDIDRGRFSHYFLKEIYQSPTSVEKTIQGKLFRDDRHLPMLDNTILPKDLRRAFACGKIRKICCVGQGTASVAASAIAYRMSHTLDGKRFQVQGIKASELSGFHLQPDMSDTLVIAVTQSGTTTDTNRAVDMVKKRGARTMAVVNRRNSHITNMVDGVFYTSDGRDIEMSVASTKAFYTQVAAGEILTLAFAEISGDLDKDALSARIESLKRLPKLLTQVLAKEKHIANLAGKWASNYQHWAIVGSGANRIAAEEVRIKLSELCYKSIACDCVEDKKHIDLSAEPMILVCSAGTPEGVLGDLVKDVAIFKAHNSAPIAIVHEGEERFTPYACGIIEVPRADSLSSLILNTMAGHLFGYHAACSIHEQSLFFSGLRAMMVAKLSDCSWGETLTCPEIQREIANFSREFHHRRRSGAFTAAMSLSTCTDLSLLLLHASGKLPPIQFSCEFGKPESPENIGEKLLICLNQCIEELCRPVDAIKHQAKTVTVGTSRLEPEIYQGVVFKALREMGITQESLRGDICMRLLQLQPAISRVNGCSDYRVFGLGPTGQPTKTSTIKLWARSGIASDIPSRSSDKAIPLVGTKRAVVQKSRVFLGLGLSDKRPILIVPAIDKRGVIFGLALLHITFAKQVAIEEIKALLSSGVKYQDIQNIVTEADISWKDEYLQLLTPKFLAVHNAKEVASALIEKIDKR